MNKTALICGISGQDGSLLAAFLLSKGYRVIGQMRTKLKVVNNLEALGIFKHVELYKCNLSNKEEVKRLFVLIDPDEVYNLSGQSSVGLSFEKPAETIDSHTLPTLNLLEIIREENKPIKLFNAGSGEAFGSVENAIDLDTPLNPRSPYGVAKAAAFLMVKNYREAYGIYACTGILFNHESPLRPEKFVTQKIVKAACLIAEGKQKTLELGNLDVVRDWGWAEEYVEAMWLMLQQSKAGDFVIATGKKYRLKDFVICVFECLNLDWHNYVTVNPKFVRESEVQMNFGNPARTKKLLGWKAKLTMEDVVRHLLSNVHQVKGRYI
ncbi:MAG: GDP-mannose 4,6-dehydratase [Ghiorsea sp.]